MESQPVASGFAYAGGGQAIRGKGSELTWTKADGTIRTCREQGSAMAQPQVQPPAMVIAGTQWTLVSFQSSDDSIGTLVPPNPDRYTLDFGADGTLAARLDCNRATGAWKASNASPTGGSLAITGGAMTRAMCGPGAMDSRIAADLRRIRTYTLRGDRLFLALEADAGIYEFRRSDV
jgi:heat shock protein HslJ